MRNSDPDEDTNYWMSYSDVMAGLLLMVILLLVLMVFDFTGEVRAQDTQLREVQRRLEEQVGVRRRIIEELLQAFDDSGLTIEIDEATGAIRLPGQVLFPYDEANLTPQGREFLVRFFPPYAKVLLDPRYSRHLEQIVIEGHTDTAGGFMYNLELSQRRAFAVAKYILSDEFPDFEFRSELPAFLTANGRSYSDPVYSSTGMVDAAKSRRVEFKFRLKDQVFIEEMRAILEEIGR